MTFEIFDGLARFDSRELATARMMRNCSDREVSAMIAGSAFIERMVFCTGRLYAFMGLI